jgi:nucleoside 2-deoxyribosyltransferase
MPPKLKAYLAGPDVFLPNAVEIGRRKIARCARFGIDARYPLDNEVGNLGSRRQMAMTISRLNEELIRGCDIVIANLTPFRSPSVDPGTAFEIGYARALEKRVFGYSASAATLLERTRAFLDLGHDAAVDADENAIEDFGLHDNLMIDGAIEACGGEIVTVPENALAAMAAFEELLPRIADVLELGTPNRRVRV